MLIKSERFQMLVTRTFRKCLANCKRSFFRMRPRMSKLWFTSITLAMVSRGTNYLHFATKRKSTHLRRCFGVLPRLTSHLSLLSWTVQGRSTKQALKASIRSTPKARKMIQRATCTSLLVTHQVILPISQVFSMHTLSAWGHRQMIRPASSPSLLD